MLPPADENAAAISDTKGSGEGYVYRFRDLVGERAGWVKQIIVESKLYFSSPARFNDPFDCQARYQIGDPSKLKTKVKARATEMANESGMPRRQRRQLERAGVHPDILLIELTKGAQKAIEKDVRVLSLSSTHENILMWSHYTFGHQGVCLQFRIEADRGFFAGAQPVQYSKDLPIPELLGDPMEQVDKLLLTKAIDWHYEHEWRLVRTDGITLDQFPPQLLTGIILGTNISQENKRAVLEWTERRSEPLAVYAAKLDSKAFRLNFEQIR